MKLLFEKVFDIIFKYKRLIFFIFLLFLFAAAWYLKHKGYLEAENVVSLLESHPVSAPLLFMLFYAVMIIFLIVTLPLNLLAGFLWGPFWGGLITLAGVAAGSIISFIISRYLFHDYLNKKFKNEYWLYLKRKVRENNWKIVAFTRINPVFPSGLVNYFLGLTPISFKDYFWSTVVFMSPVIFIFSFLGNLIGGFVLTGKIYNLVRDVFIIFLISTILAGLIFSFRKYYSRGI